jgi:hypothetical protein
MASRLPNGKHWDTTSCCLGPLCSCCTSMVPHVHGATRAWCHTCMVPNTNIQRNISFILLTQHDATQKHVTKQEQTALWRHTAATQALQQKRDALVYISITWPGSHVNATALAVEMHSRKCRASQPCSTKSTWYAGRPLRQRLRVQDKRM